jgi:hypothetical protein
LSAKATDSAVFRLTPTRHDFLNVAVDMALRNNGLTSTSRTPAVDWDGVHIFLRYQSEYNLYYASINRRDNTLAIKKKDAGGTTNGGTYYILATGKHTVPYGQWQHVRATIQTNPDNSVTIRLYAEGQLLLSATDNGTIGGPPILTAGKTGIRADNCNFQFDDFTVSAL